jgi:hypothetical protein
VSARPAHFSSNSWCDKVIKFHAVIVIWIEPAIFWAASLKFPSST